MPGCLPMGISENCVVRKCIIDKNARIGPGVKILNADNVQESNREDEGFVIKVRLFERGPLLGCAGGLTDRRAVGEQLRRACCALRCQALEGKK